MSKNMSNNEPFSIFDSRTAKRTYKDYEYYRSSTFKVPGGCVAIVELTAHSDNLKELNFSAIRIPAGQSSDGCYEIKGVGKRYRQWKSCKRLGSDVSPTGRATEYTDYNKSVIRWGWDQLNKEIVQFAYITRPGEYYLIGNKCDNKPVECCNSATIIEVTLVPAESVIELTYPCCVKDV